MIAHRQVLHAIAATCVLSVLLGVWRLAYPLTDAAGLPLLALGLLLGASHMMLVREPYRVCMRAVVRRESCLSRWLTGQCRAVRGALLFACAAVPLLAWLALRIDMLETLTFVVLALLASVAYGGLRTYTPSREMAHSLNASQAPSSASPSASQLCRPGTACAMPSSSASAMLPVATIAAECSTKW